ncbi:DUF2237 domain-containing protein [Francisella sp. Scap27]|uniref:DUF2237 family protein n=1 Tax=Francisella sp. Scap27 TaxID=2589986 RepID=UPI0015B8389A|nr:DUF2237 domain-containing protein [Francisella sp. Scap27]QLE78657.1 DUF2237 domain-containing protein [Francisella sp. Scap27]
MSNQKNVLGSKLQACCFESMTGYYRDGFCKTETADFGLHTVCAIMTQEFLDYTASKGNDLSTPNRAFGFRGLKPGDKWCLCALRWLEAYTQGVAPKVILEATNELTLEVISIETLEKMAHS